MAMNSKEFLPKHLRDQEFWDKASVLVDYLYNKWDAEIEKVKAKYNCVDNFDEEIVRQVLQEFGYQYILNVTELTEDELKRLFNYVNIIHFQKGTKVGLELIFLLLKLDVQMTEWWEKSPQGDPYTFEMEVNVALSEDVKWELISVLIKFLREYVYPIVRMTILYFYECHMYVAAAEFIGAQTTTYPETVTEDEKTFELYTAAVCIKGALIRVLPGFVEEISDYGRIDALWQADYDAESGLEPEPSIMGEITNLWQADYDAEGGLEPEPSIMGDIPNIWEGDYTPEDGLEPEPSIMGEIVNFWQAGEGEDVVEDWQPVTWANLINATATPDANDLTKTAGIPEAFEPDAGAVSSMAIPSIIAGAGVEFKLYQPSGVDGIMIAGLTSQHLDQTGAYIDFGFKKEINHTGNPADPYRLYIVESAFRQIVVETVEGNPDDLYRILINGTGQVEYWINKFDGSSYLGWNLIDTTTETPIFPLFVDAVIGVALADSGAGIRDAMLNHATIPVPDEALWNSIVWQYSDSIYVYADDDIGGMYKYYTSDNWDAGSVSNKLITTATENAGVMFMFSVPEVLDGFGDPMELNEDMAIGLTTENHGLDYMTLDYGIRLEMVGEATLEIIENGTSRMILDRAGNYWDRYKIILNASGQVEYWRSQYDEPTDTYGVWSLLYTSTTMPTLPLFVKGLVKSPNIDEYGGVGVGIGMAMIRGVDPNSIWTDAEWMNMVNVEAAPSVTDLTKVGGLNGVFDAGATSSKSLSSGTINNSGIEFCLVNSTGICGCGLSNDNSDLNYTHINFCIIRTREGTADVKIVEDGVEVLSVGRGEMTDDIFRIIVNGAGQVEYWRNNVETFHWWYTGWELLYTSLNPPAYPTYPLLIDTALGVDVNDLGITGMRLRFATADTPVNPMQQWEGVDLTWVNSINTHVAGDLLCKNYGTADFDAEATSSTAIPSAIEGAGIEFMLASAWSVCGLAHENYNWSGWWGSYGSIDFGIHYNMNSTPYVEIVEGGLSVFELSEFDVLDKYRIIINALGEVEYWQSHFDGGAYGEWTILFVSTQTPVFPCFAKAFIHSPISDAVGIGGAKINGGTIPMPWMNVESWLNLTNCYAPTGVPNKIIKNGGVENAWDAGAFSSVYIPNVEGAGLEFQCGHGACGLSNVDTNQDPYTIDFGVLSLTGDIPGSSIMEDGIGFPVSYINVDDIVRILVNASGQVEYWRNDYDSGTGVYLGWTLMYTSAIVPVFPLRVDLSLDKYNANVKGIKSRYGVLPT